MLRRGSSYFNVRANRNWKYKETHCLACKDESTEETGRHILECKVLCSENDDISYIPRYADLFSSNVQEQVYTSQIMSKNMQIIKQYLPLPQGPRELTLVMFCCFRTVLDKYTYTVTSVTNIATVQESLQNIMTTFNCQIPTPYFTDLTDHIFVKGDPPTAQHISIWTYG